MSSTAVPVSASAPTADPDILAWYRLQAAHARAAAAGVPWVTPDLEQARRDARARNRAARRARRRRSR